MARSRKLSRREREKLRHRQEILETALDLFATKGYHNVSMHEIAAGAEFSVGTLYGFFENKEALYKALMLEKANVFHDAIMSALDEGEDELAKIECYVRAKGRMFMDHAKLIRLYFTETRGASFNIKAGLDSKIRRMHEESLQKLARIFKSGIKKKLFRNLPPYYLAISLDSLTNAFLFCWLEDPEAHAYEANVGVLTDMFFNGVSAKKTQR